MNILIANTQEFNPRIGGVESVSNIIASELKIRGNNVYFIADKKCEYDVVYNINVEQMILDKDNLSKDKCKKMYEIVKKHNINIIINQAGNIEYFTALCNFVAKKSKIKLISVIHTDPMYREKLLRDFGFSKLLYKENLKAIIRFIIYPIRKIIIKNEDFEKYSKIFQYSDRIVLLSERYKDYFNNKKYNQKIISVINNPISNIKNQKHLIKENRVLFVGRINIKQKRLDILISIWEKIVQNFPNWNFDILGDGPDKNILEKYINKKKIKNINFYGFRDPEIYYRRSEIICLTSTIEGFPMVLVEGMSYGCIPIIFETFSAAKDIIDNDINGYLIKRNKKAEYFVRLSELMSNKNQIEYMSKQAIEKSKIFNLNKIVDHWEEIINE